MKIATYNVNSINARLGELCEWLVKEKPDVVMLQEIKCEFNTFPFFEINAAGYEAKVFGQKSYNGVAVLSREKINVICENIPSFKDENARYLEVMTTVKGEKIKVASIYLPNGTPPSNNPSDMSKFSYKLGWIEAFSLHTQELVHSNEPVILGGDFNIILSDADVYNPEAFRGGVLYRPEVVNRLKAMMHQGWYDAFRLCQKNTGALNTQKENGYTYWDYSGGAFMADLGLRIDYLLLSPKAADRLVKCWVDRTPRQGVKPSDHTALVAELR